MRRPVLQSIPGALLAIFIAAAPGSVMAATCTADDFAAAGFAIDSVSKSGTSRYSGQASYQFQTQSMAADLTSGAQSRYQADRSWLDVNAGGPVLKDKLFFYGSYYRPTNNRSTRANLYGPLPPFKSDRKIWKLMKDASKAWDEQIYCVPSEEFKFNKLIRDGNVGKP